MSRFLRFSVGLSVLPKTLIRPFASSAGSVVQVSYVPFSILCLVYTYTLSFVYLCILSRCT